MLVEHSYFKNHSYDYIDEKEIPNKTGFRSICKYLPEDVAAAKAVRSTSVLKGCMLFVDTLFMDFDDCEHSANDFNKWLKTENIAYERYNSGNRSVHFHIPVVLPPSPYAAYTLKKYVHSWTNGTADTSFYHHAGLFRLSGTAHEKTGISKALVETGGWCPVELDIIEPESKFEVIDTDLDLLQYALIQYESTFGQSVLPGNRHMTLWKNAKTFSDAGVSYSTALELLQRLNDSWHDPKPQEEVEKAVMGAYR